MISKETKGRAQTLATETAEERRLTRKFVAERRWRMAEPDAVRSKAFATREIRRGAARSRADAIQGDTINFVPASFLVEGTV
jgi:hypothetical protein